MANLKVKRAGRTSFDPFRRQKQEDLEFEASLEHDSQGYIEKLDLEKQTNKQTKEQNSQKVNEKGISGTERSKVNIKLKTAGNELH